MPFCQSCAGPCKQAFCAWFKSNLEGKRCKTIAQKKKEKFFLCFCQGVEGELGLLSFVTLTPLKRFTSHENDWNTNSTQFSPQSVFPSNLDWRQLVLVWAVCYIRITWVVKDGLGLWVAFIICNRHPTNRRDLGPGYRPTYGSLRYRPLTHQTILMPYLAMSSILPLALLKNRVLVVLPLFPSL